MVQSDLPFIATAALLALWGTGRNDSNVAFFGAIFALSYVIVAGLSQTAVNNAVTLPGEAIPQTDVFSQYFADHTNSLSTFLMMMFCFAFGAVGTTVFAFSPFAGEILYAAVVSALFRDVSIVGDARVIVWACVIVSGALSEHVFRLNLAALCLGLMFWERGIVFPQRGALESLCLVNGVIILTIHDIVVRFFLDPIKALIEAGFLAMTAFVMVDSAIELGALPSTVGQTQKPNITGVANLMNIKWTDCLEIRSYPFNEDFPKRLALASPVLSCLFCAGYFYRTIQANRADLTWIKWQQVIGVGVGTALGLHLWTRYGGVNSFMLSSPIAVCWVTTSLLFYTSTLLNASAFTTSKSDIWHHTYWRGGPWRFGSKKNGESGSKVKKSTPYPTLLLASFSATYPEIYDLALKLEDDHFSLETNLAKLRSINERDRPVDHARQAFACTQLVSTLVKHCEDLTTKLDAKVSALQREATALSLAQEMNASVRSRQRQQFLQQDLVGIQSYADQLRRELAKRDDDALRVLEVALRLISSQKQPASAEEERKLKLEADEIDLMCEAVRKRIKHRKKREADGTQGASNASDLNSSVLSTSAPPPPVMGSSATDTMPLPVIPPNQAMFSSDREGSESKSPGSKKSGRRGLLPSFFKKKSTPSSPEQASVLDDRQSASSSGKSGSAKKWGSFMRRSGKAASPSAAT